MTTETNQTQPPQCVVGVAHRRKGSMNPINTLTQENPSDH